MAESVILGISHDTCIICKQTVKMRVNRRLYHHGHPAHRCPGTGEYGQRITRFLAEMIAHHQLLNEGWESDPRNPDAECYRAQVDGRGSEGWRPPGGDSSGPLAGQGPPPAHEHNHGDPDG